MEFIEKFKNYLLSKANGSSKVTVKNYLADVKQFVSWVEVTYKKTFTASEISIQTIDAFKSEKAQTLSASSLDRHISSLRKFFTFLKLNGYIAHSPFDQPTKSSEALAKEDPWHLHDFKNYLYVYNASHLTIKNYLIDVKQFLGWAEEVLAVQDAYQVAEKNVLHRIDNKLVEAYKNRLLQQHIFSPVSVNRKLSSLRKYLSWATEQGLLNSMTDFSFSSHEKVNDEGKFFSQATIPNPLPETQGEGNQRKVTKYSKIPPIRLFQKLTNAGTFAFDLLIVSPVAHVFRKVEHETWKIKGKKIFAPAKKISNVHYQISNIQKFASFSMKPNFSNVSKEFYAPLSISTKDFTWYKKALHHMRHTRPQWYHRYHQLAIAHYFNWAVLIIFATAIGFGMFSSFVSKPGKSFAALPTAPIRVLSFQGRLTDANDNPITTPSWIRFEIYNTQSSSGSARLWEEVDKVAPDQDGIFSLLLGSDGLSDGGPASLCNSGNPPASPATGACGIPTNLFSNNNALWLGVTVENTAELAPREQLATVAYASNSETLQGLQPITAAGAGTQNVVLALNSSGNLAIGASTTFQATSGTFTLSGNTVAINTNPGTNGNIVLAPDGQGFVDIQRPLQTSTNNGDIASVPNALTIEDLAAIQATSSGQSALTINQNGTGPIISASASGVAKFTVDSSGNGTFTGNVTGNTFYTGNGSTYYINNNTSHLNSLTLAGSLAVSGNVASDLIPSATNTYSLGNATNQWLNLYAQNIFSNGQPLSQLWQENNGALSPIHTQDDLIIGGTATSDAKFQVYGTTGQTYVGGQLGVGTATPLTASGIDVEKDSLGNATVLVHNTSPANVADLFTASNSAGTKFTIKNDGTIVSGKYTTAGGVFYTNGSGNFTQASNASANTVLHGGSTPSFSAVSLTADVSGILPLSSGGTNNGLTADNGGIVYSDASKLQILAHAGSSGQCLVSGGSGAPSWAACSTGASGTNYWQLASGALSPIFPSTDILVGSSATSSAKFAVTGIAGSLTPAATISATVASGGNGNGLVLTADGSIQALMNNPLILGGNTTGDVLLKPANGSGNGYVTIYGNNLTSNNTTFNLLTNVSSLTVGAAGSTTTLQASTLDDNRATLALWATPTTINEGSSSQTFNVLGNAALGTSTSNTVTFNGLVSGAGVNNAVQPVGNGVTDLGSASHYWGTVYAENFIAPVGGGTSGFWQLTNSVLSPVNAWNDLAVGGNATSSATPFQIFATNYTNDQGTVSSGTATTSGNLIFRGTPSSQTPFKIDLLNGSSLTFNRSAGGDKGETAVFTIGNDGNLTDAGNLAVNGGSISTTNGTANLFTGNATTLNIGFATSNTNIKGNVTLGSSTSNTVTINSLIQSAISPSNVGGPYDIGSSTNRWGTLYANNTFLPSTGGIGGYWALNNGVLAPTFNTNDLAIGGSATSSAALQVFGQAYTTDATINSGTIPAGTATTSGNLTFRGTPGSQTVFQANLLNGSNLGFFTSIGGDKGLTATTPLLYLANNNRVGIGTNAPTATLDVVGAASVSSTLTFRSGTASIQATANNQLTLGGNTTGGIIFGSNITSNFIPNKADTYNLGSITNEWDTLYVRQIVSPSSGGIAGYWQLSNLGVLSPANLTNDIAVGGTATSSALFQVLATTQGSIPGGTASTAANLTFNGGNVGNAAKVNLLNGSSLGYYTSPGGDAGIGATPSLFLSASGNVGIGTTTPSTPLQVGFDSSTLPGLLIGGGTTPTNGSNVTNFISISGGRSMYGYNTTSGDSVINSGSGKGFDFFVNGTSGTFSSGTDALHITSAGFAGIGTGTSTTTLGNAQLVVNQGNTSGDIFTASSSATTQFVINNNGNVAIGPGVTTAQGILDVASQGPLFPSDLTLNQVTATNLVPNPSFEESSPTSPTLGWTLSATAQLTSSLATESAIFGSTALRFYNVGPSATYTGTSACIAVTAGSAYTASAYIYRVAGFSGNTGIDVQTFTNGSCSTGQATAGRVNTTVTNTWTRLTTTLSAAAMSGINSVEVRFITDGSNTSSRAYADGFQVEAGTSATPYLDGSLGPGYAWTGVPDNSSSVRQSGSAFAYQTLNSAGGIGAAGRTTYPTLQLDQDGTGDILTASASGTTEIKLSNSGQFFARNLYDLDNPIYYIDPAGLTVSASVAGSMTFTPAAEHDINFLNNSNINFQSSVGGDAGLTSRLFIQGSSGNIGVGNTTPVSSLDVSIGVNAGSGGDALVLADSLAPTMGMYDAASGITPTISGGVLDNGGPSYRGDVAIWDATATGQTMTFDLTAGIPNVMYITFGSYWRTDTSTTPKGFTISYSDDNVTYTTLTTVTNYTAATWKYYVGGLTHRYWRMTVNTLQVGKSHAYISGFQLLSTYYGALAGEGSQLWGQNPALAGGNAIFTRTTGNVGIGKTNPGFPLDVNGIGEFSGNTQIGNGVAQGYYGDGSNLALRGYNVGTSALYIQSYGGASTVMYAGYSGTYANNVGIDNAAPTRTLDVTGSWGGNDIYYSPSGTGGTQTIPDKALAYYCNWTDTATSGSQTENCNITGLPNTDGTWFMYVIRLSTSGGAGTLNIQVNGGAVLGHVISSGGGNRIHGICVYMGGFNGWECMGSNLTNASSVNDLAETIPFAGTIPQLGSLLTANTSTSSAFIKQSNSEYDQKAMGIVTTNPALVFGLDENNHIPNGYTQIALSGRVPAIVTSLDGSILQGDSITTSPLTGVGMKPNKPTQTVGKTLEQFNPSQMTCTTVSSYNAILWPADDGTNSSHPCFAVPVSSFDAVTQTVLSTEYHLQPSDNIYVGKVMVLVGNSYVDPDVYLTSTGDFNFVDGGPKSTIVSPTGFTIPHYYTLSDAFGNPITRMGAFLELAVGNLRAGSVNAQQVLTNSLAVATDNVSIAGQSLNDYVTGIVTNILNTKYNIQNAGVVSPIAQINQLHTGIISPLGDNGQLAIRINNSGIEIAKDASSSAVASIDNNGNATFSGSLNSGNLAVNGDATISGTLHANSIEANSIAGLQEVVSTLSAQNITNVTNIYFATPSAAPLADNSITGFGNGSSSNSALPSYALSATPFANIASYSAYFAYVPNLNATTGMFQQGLVSLGPTSLSDTSVTGTLSIGSQLMLTDNSINVLGGDFEIQPLKQGGINFEGGLIAIDTNGNLTVNGNAVFNNNLAVNTISPLPGKDVNVILNDSEGSLDSSPTAQNDTKFNVQNASGSAIFAVNQLGDLMASGAATVGKLNLSLVQPALAVSDTEVVATGSAGTTNIKAYQREVTIDNPNVTANSLIYITPVGTDQTPYLERQVTGKSFSVGIPVATNNNVNFNWLIVN